MDAMFERVKSVRPVPLLLTVAVLLAACAEAKDGLQDIGKVRATFYRHELKVAATPLEMPGQRLVPNGGCDRPRDGNLFDPCRPDPESVELDAYGMPKTPPGPWAARRTTAASTMPARKPAQAGPVASRPVAAKPVAAKAVVVRPAAAKAGTRAAVRQPARAVRPAAVQPRPKPAARERRR